MIKNITNYHKINIAFLKNFKNNFKKVKQQLNYLTLKYYFK